MFNMFLFYNILEVIYLKKNLGLCNIMQIFIAINEHAIKILFSLPTMEHDAQPCLVPQNINKSNGDNVSDLGALLRFDGQ